MSGEPRTLDEWRRARALADAELESFDRRMAAELVQPEDLRGIARAFLEAPRVVQRKALVNAAEDARLGLLRAKHAAQAAGEAADEAEANLLLAIHAAASRSDAGISASRPTIMAGTTETTEADGESSEAMLPGQRRWSEIEAKYRELAASPAAWNRRRRSPGEPSRPELAKALDMSPATLKRACKEAGRGTRWPPVAG